MIPKKILITKTRLYALMMDSFIKGKNDYPDRKFQKELNRDLKFLFGEF